MHRILYILSLALFIAAETEAWSATTNPSNKLALPLSLPFMDASDLTPYWLEEQGSLTSAHTPATVQSFHAVNQDNQTITEKAFDGKISVVSFFFAQCGSTWPRLMHSIQSFQAKIKKEGLASKVNIISFSVTPDEDTPSDLKHYAKMRGFDLSNWALLTGNRSEIYRVGKETFKADRSVAGQKSDTSFIHSENLYLVDSKRRIRGIYVASSNKEMTLLSEDIQKLNHEQ